MREMKLQDLKAQTPAEFVSFGKGKAVEMQHDEPSGCQKATSSQSAATMVYLVPIETRPANLN
jgi:hypothetical protein